MKDGLQLADWYVNETERLQIGARADPRLIRARTLLEWFQGRDENEASFRDILQFGPTSVRTKATAEDAVSLLLSHHWLSEISPRPRRFQLMGEGG